MLIREIVAGRIADGTRLPSERQMAIDYGIAIGTLRKALADLEIKGVLERVHGSGNYVRSKSVVNSVYSFFRLELREGGGLPRAKMLEVKHKKKSGNIPNFGTSSYGHRFRRLRYLNETPVALEEIWLDGDKAATINPDELSDSLYAFYKDTLGIIISRAEDKLNIASAPNWSPDTSNITRGAITGYIERIAWDQQDKSVEFSRTWFNPELAVYINRFASPVAG